MVTRLLRLRLAELISPFRESAGRALRFTLLIVLGAGGAIGLAWFPTRFASSPELLADLDVVVGATLLMLTVLIPFFTSRRHWDPRQFGQFPATIPRIAAGILFTSPVTWSFLWMLTWAGSFLNFRRDLFQDAGAAVVGMSVALVSALVFSRVSSAVAQLLFTTSRALTIRSALGVILVVAALPAALFFLLQTLQSAGESSLADAALGLSWTPFGAPFAALSVSTSGPAVVFASFGIMIAVVALLIGAWFSLTAIALTRVSKPQVTGLIKRRVGWFSRVPAHPAMIIGARSMTYWGRDPRYRINMIAIPFAPLLIMLVLHVGGVDPAVLTLVPVPVILLLLSWMTHNDVAYDSTAFWLHIASGTKGWHDRLGRLFPILLIGIPVLLIGTSISVTVLGDWRTMPGVFALNLTVLLAGAASVSISSVLFPYPTTRPGDSPFVQPQWSGAGAGLAQTLSLSGGVVLAFPTLWMAADAIANPTPAVQLAVLAFSGVYGIVILVLGILIGGLIFNRRSSELLAITQVFD